LLMGFIAEFSHFRRITGRGDRPPMWQFGQQA
jgi:hypothetical protein